MNPGLDRTLGGRGWCIQGDEFSWHGKKWGRTRCVTRGGGHTEGMEAGAEIETVKNPFLFWFVILIDKNSLNSTR